MQAVPEAFAKMSVTGVTPMAASITPAEEAPVAKKGAKRPKTVKTEVPVPEESPEEKGDPQSWLIVAKAVRITLKNHSPSMHCGADALPALNSKLLDIIQGAMARAERNGRKTLKACDF